MEQKQAIKVLEVRATCWLVPATKSTQESVCVFELQKSIKRDSMKCVPLRATMSMQPGGWEDGGTAIDAP